MSLVFEEFFNGMESMIRLINYCLADVIFAAHFFVLWTVILGSF